MASTPASPAPTSANLHPIVNNWIALIKAHETLLVVVLSVGLLWHFCGTGLSALVDHDKTQQAIEQSKSAALVQQNTQLAQQGAALLAQVKASNAALAAAMAQRAVVTQKQQIADQTLPLPELGQRWVSLVNGSSADITAQPDGSMKVSDTASRTTVEQLETIPQLKADVAGAQQTTQNDQNIINQQNTQIGSLNATVAQDKTTCDAELKTANAKAKRGFWRGTKFGSILSVALYEGFRIAIGHP